MYNTEILNKIFSTRMLKNFIPLVNTIITLLKSKKFVITKFDKNNERFVQKENRQIIYVDESPYWNGTFSLLKKTLMEISCKHYIPKQGDTVIDIGAGVGTETIIFQELVGNNGKVYAIEAHPKTAASLRLLILLNKFNNVTPYQIAIGNQNCFIKIEDKKLHVANAIIKGNEEEGIEIEMKTFDNFVHAKNIEKVDFLKVNIEGAEENMIEGMEKSIGIIKNIAISCHDFLEEHPTDRIKNKVSNFLITNGFQVEFSNDEHPVRRSWIYAKRKTL